MLYQLHGVSLGRLAAESDQRRCGVANVLDVYLQRAAELHNSGTYLMVLIKFGLELFDVISKRFKNTDHRVVVLILLTGYFHRMVLHCPDLFKSVISEIIHLKLLLKARPMPVTRNTPSHPK